MLRQKLFKGTPPEEMPDILATNCENIREEFSFTKQLDEEMLNLKREQKVNIDIEVSRRELELKDYIKSEKDAMKPMLENAGKLMQSIKDRYEEVKETVYIFIDEESGMIGYYDSKGEMVSSRRMTPEEKQKSIFSDINISSNSPI